MIQIHKKFTDIRVKELINRRTFHHRFSLIPRKMVFDYPFNDFSRFIFCTVLAVKERDPMGPYRGFRSVKLINYNK